MSIAINPNRRFTFQSTFDPDISIEFLFQSSEDVVQKKGEDGHNPFYRTIRKSIVGWTGVEALDGKPLPMSDEAQRFVFEFMTTMDPDMFLEVMEKFEGLTPKKLIGGSKLPQSGNGIHTTAEDASSEENAENGTKKEN